MRNFMQPWATLEIVNQKSVVVIVAVGVVVYNNIVKYFIYTVNIYFASSRGAEYCVSMSVYLSVCLLAYLENHRLNSMKFSVHVSCDCGSILLWWQFNTLSTSGFVDDVIFAHNGANRPKNCRHLMTCICCFQSISQQQFYVSAMHRRQAVSRGSIRVLFVLEIEIRICEKLVRIKQWHRWP